MNCKNCQNELICKFTDHASDIKHKVNEIQILINCPVSIKIECSKFIENKPNYFNGLTTGGISKQSASY